MLCYLYVLFWLKKKYHIIRLKNYVRTSVRSNGASKLTCLSAGTGRLTDTPSGKFVNCGFAGILNNLTGVVGLTRRSNLQYLNRLSAEIYQRVEIGTYVRTSIRRFCGETAVGTEVGPTSALATSEQPVPPRWVDPVASRNA